MKVAEVAWRAGVGAHTVRFYVRAGLLRAERDPSNNYKQFGESHVVRLRFIKRTQSLGFCLAEIRALLARMDSGECTCKAMHLQLADKILELHQQIEELQRRRAFMQRVYDDWQAGADGPHGLGRLCRFLDQQAAPSSSRSAAEPAALATLDQSPFRTRVPRRTGKGASSGASGKRALRPKAGFRAEPFPRGANLVPTRKQA